MKRLNDLSVTKKLKNTNLSYFLTLNDISSVSRDDRFLFDNPKPRNHKLGGWKNKLGLLTYALFSPLRKQKRKL